MEGRYAKIRDNIIINVVMYDPENNPLADYYTFVELAEDQGIEIGWAYDPVTGEFEPRNGQVPQTTVEVFE